MSGSGTGQQLSPEFLAERNNPYLAWRISIAFIFIDTFFLVIFYVSRYFNKKAVGRSMLWCNTLAYVLCMGSAAAGMLMAEIGGAGHHAASVPISTFVTWMQLSKVLEFTYTPAVMFAKLAALSLYYQLFELPMYRRAIMVIGAILIAQGAVSMILAFSICRPFRYFWTQVIDPNDGKCGDVMMFYKLYSIPSLVTDAMMLVLPWPILIKLHVPMSEKIGLILTFLAASLGIITCALRFVAFFTTPLFSDPTWYASGGTTIYALVEPSIYMIASILPTTRHLYRRIRRKVRETAQQRKPKESGDPTNSSATRSADVERNENKPKSKILVGIRQDVDIWQTNTNSSQEGLTLGEFYQSHQDWNQLNDLESNSNKALSNPKPREFVKKQIKLRDKDGVRPIA